MQFLLKHIHVHFGRHHLGISPHHSGPSVAFAFFRIIPTWSILQKSFIILGETKAELDSSQSVASWYSETLHVGFTT